MTPRFLSQSQRFVIPSLVRFGIVSPALGMVG
jgi:hypothetical protein